MGFLGGFVDANNQYERQAYDRKQAEERAARERENHAYLMEQRERDRRNQTSMDEGYTTLQNRLQSDTGEQQYENLGLTPRKAQQGYAPAADGFGPTQPEIEAGPSSFNRGPQYAEKNAGLMTELKMARNNPQLMAEIQRRHQQGKIDSDAMKIGEYVRSADDATIGELAQKVTLDKQNTYSLKPSKTPGLYTVETKLGNAELNRNQLADYIEGMHRLKMGDPAGKALINAISPALLAAAEAKRDNLREDSKEAREVFGAESTRMGVESQDRYRQEMAAGRQEATAARGQQNQWRMEEDKKLAFTSAQKELAEAEKDHNKLLMDFGNDPKIKEHPAFASSIKRLGDAEANRFAAGISSGVISPGQVAQQIMSSAKNDQEVLQSLTQVANIGGPDYGDQVFALIEGNPTFKALPKTGKPPQQQAPTAGLDLRRAVTQGAPASQPQPRGLVEPQTPYYDPIEPVPGRAGNGRFTYRGKTYPSKELAIQAKIAATGAR